MEDVKGKELVDDNPPPVDQNDNKNETEIHKQPSSESEVTTTTYRALFNSSYDLIVYWLLAITEGKCDQEKVWRIVAKEGSFDIQGNSFFFLFFSPLIYTKEKKNYNFFWSN